jgi:hypothetical protein
MTTITRTKVGHWAAQDFVDSRFQALANNSRAQRIGIISAQLDELAEHCRANPKTAPYLEHDMDELREELRSLRRPPSKPSAGFVCACVVILPLALVSVVSLVGHFIQR